MKFYSILFSLLAFSFYTKAQTVTVNYSPSIEGVDLKYGRVQWIGDRENLSFINTQGVQVKKTSMVNEVKSDMTIGSKNEFGLSGLNDENFARIWNVKNTATGFDALISMKESSSDNLSLKIIHLDKSGVVTKEDEEIGSYPSNAIGILSKTVSSPDGNFTMFYNKPNFLNSDLSFAVIDGANKAVRNFGMKTGFSYSAYKLVSAVLDNAGNIYTLSTIQTATSTYAYQLKLYGATDDKGVEVAIASMEKLKFVDDLFLNSDTKGAIYLSGRFLEHKDQNLNAEGFFIQKINAETGKATLWMNANFSVDAKELKVLARTMRVDKIVFLPDGNFGMVGECVFQTGDGFTNTDCNDRLYDWMESVLIMKVSADGKILNHSIIERDQNIVDPAKRIYCGSAFLMKGTKCYLIYNEALGSIEKRKAGSSPSNYSAYRDKSAMVIAEIDLTNCSYNEKYLNDIKPCTDKLKPILIPGFSQLLNDNNSIAVKIDTGVKTLCKYAIIKVE